MGMLENLIITAVEETVPGTLEPDAGNGTDAIRFTQDTKPPKTEQEWIDNPEGTGTLGAAEGFLGPRKGGFDIGMLLRGSGYYNVAPPMGKLLTACGFRESLPVGGVVAAETTASTTVFTVSGTALTDEDDILVEIGTAFEPVHIDALSAGGTTGTETITLLSALSQAPANGAEIIKLIVEGTIIDDPAPSTTGFDVSGSDLQEGDVILVEITGASGNYYETIVQTTADEVGYQRITVAPALPSAPASGDNVVVKAVSEYVLIAAAPTTTAFTVFGATVDLQQHDVVLVDVSATATASYEPRRITNVIGGSEACVITLNAALSAAPTAGHAVLGQPTYTLTSDRDDHKSLSIYHYLDGIKISNSGCRGMVKFDFKWKELAKAMFTFVPLDWAESDAAYGMIPNFTALQTALPVMGGVFQRGGVDTYIESLSVDLGQAVPALGAIQTRGYYQNFMGKRNVVGTFDPFAANSTVLADFKAGATAAIWFTLGSGNNQVVVSMPKTKYKDVSFADREGINTYNIGFQASETTGDDEFIIAFCSETFSS